MNQREIGIPKFVVAADLQVKDQVRATWTWREREATRHSADEWTRKEEMGDRRQQESGGRQLLGN